MRLLVLLILASWAWIPDIQAQSSSAPEGMTLIESGIYRPLYREDGQAKERHVDAFYLDVQPVTNAEFLSFVKANPQWQRSRVAPIFADASYLYHWAGDLELGDKVHPDSPVTHVSWFAARSYAQWRNKRLPTLDEWEYVAAASETAAHGADDPAYYERLLAWYSQPTPASLPAVRSTPANYWGVYDLHGVIWEWVGDFNSALVTGESRGDSGLERALFCGSGALRAADFKDYAAFMRFAFRSSLKATYAVPNLGFRCARDVSSE